VTTRLTVRAAVALALAAFTIALSTPPLDARQSPSRAPGPVVIVGAGLTGLTTAYELRKAGVDAIILEASAYAGGRIQTVTFGDGTHVEAHMEEYWARSPAYKLLRELNVPLVEDVAHSTLRIDATTYPYQGDGDRDEYLRGIFSDAERAAFVEWNAKVWHLYDRLEQTHFAGKPLDAELAALRTISFADFVRRDALPSRVSEWIRVTVEPEMAIEWDQIAALDGIDEMRLFLDSPDGFGEKNYHVKGGNSGFVRALVAKVGRGRIRLESQVTAIERLTDGIRVRYLERGSTYRDVNARAVVVTVPLYALNRIQFIPPLSAERRKAIDTTRFGAYVKVHLRVAAAAAPLWEPKGETLLTMLTDSPAGSVYEATVFQAHGATADRYLTLLVHARFAQQMLAMNADDMRTHAIRSLDALFPGIAPHVELAEIFPYPTAVAYWPLSLGRSRFDDLAATLRTPEGGIWIGGDTTENSHSEGAVQAAYRMAAQVAATVGKRR
jgi:monoamine oxidase